MAKKKLTIKQQVFLLERKLEICMRQRNGAVLRYFSVSMCEYSPKDQIDEMDKTINRCKIVKSKKVQK